ncbi:MAG: hypothetical protein QOJ07_395 [Thermoleophilaceae bacterium]|nr:hypothetical protein [Thermoleophilaceae bacterium]
MAAGLTIEELSRRTGVTVRNIRAHQSRGLLAPPSVRGRVALYGPEHVARLELIRVMQADGLNLRAIQRLIESGAAGTELLDFRRALVKPFETEEPGLVTAAELVERFGRVPLETARRVERLGLLVPLGEGRWRVPSPALLRVGEQIVALGVSLDATLSVLERLQSHSEAVSDAFAGLFLDEVLAPFDGAGRPAEDWPRVSYALDRLRPLAADALVAAFAPEMTRAMERVAERHLSGS